MTNQAEIVVTVSNKELSEQSGTETGMLAYTMSRLEAAGVPVNGWYVDKGFTVKTGHLEYTRNAMNQGSVYTWKSDEYVKAKETHHKGGLSKEKSGWHSY